MSPRKLLRLAEQAIREAEELGERFNKALDSVFQEAQRRLRPIIHDATDAITPGQRASSAAQTQPAIRAALRRAGYDALAELAYQERLDPMIARILATRRRFGLVGELTAAQQLQLEALGSMYATDLIGQGDDTARALWRAAARGIFGGSSVDDILDELAGVVDRSLPEIRTLYDTSVSMLGRQVEALQAGDDPDTLFVYMNPVDEKTRPFCLKHAGRVYTRAQIDALDNGQIGPVFLTGGGYNCRGLWMEVSKASELSDFWNTDQRVPEIQDDIDALKDAA